MWHGYLCIRNIIISENIDRGAQGLGAVNRCRVRSLSLGNTQNLKKYNGNSKIKTGVMFSLSFSLWFLVIFKMVYTS